MGEGDGEIRQGGHQPWPLKVSRLGAVTVVSERGEKKRSYTLSIQNKLTHFYKLDKPDTASSFKPIPQHTKLRRQRTWSGPHTMTHQLHIYIYAEKLTPVSALFGGIYNSALKTADRQPICHWPVHSILEYSAMVWDPYLQKDNDHLESVQHHAPAYQTGLPIETPRPTAMLKDLELPPLAERRERQRLI